MEQQSRSWDVAQARALAAPSSPRVRISGAAAAAAAISGLALVGLLAWGGSQVDSQALAEAEPLPAGAKPSSAETVATQDADEDSPTAESEAEPPARQEMPLPDGELATLFEDNRVAFERLCNGLPDADGDGGTVEELLLDAEALAELDVVVNTTAYLLAADLARVALFGPGPLDYGLLVELGVSGGAERQTTAPGGRLELAYIDFASPFQACVFAEFDYASSPSPVGPVPLDVPGWLGENEDYRHLHFRVGDRVYLFISDLGVDPELLIELAQRQLAVMETI